MYPRNNTSFTRAATDPQYHHQQQLTLGELDSVANERAWQLNSEIMSTNNYCSSGCSSYIGSPSSLASCETQRTTSLMQRSISSHSLLYKNYKNNNNNHKNNNCNSDSNSNGNGSQKQYSISSLFAELLQSDNGPVRRVYSTGDLQRINGMQHYHHQSESPLASESSMIIEAMSRANPYSPEEKKVRIERYRSKRNQRNFNKKIKYACRKTLADSRPRIRGRFARNDEIVMMMNNQIPSSSSVQWSQFGGGSGEEEEYDHDDDNNWANFFDSFDPTLNLAADDEY